MIELEYMVVESVNKNKYKGKEHDLAHNAGVHK